MSGISPYFNKYNYGRTQKVTEDLIIQAIKIYGMEVKYIPQQFVNFDKLMVEDPATFFSDATSLEVYLNNTTGFEGDGEFLSKFGLEIRDQLNITISRRRFQQVMTEKLMLENGWNMSFEDADNKTKNQVSNIVLEDGTRLGYDIERMRPFEGDLVYFPFLGVLFEVRFVNYENNFYSFGSLYTFDLKLELYEYGSEKFDTEYAEINTMNEYSADTKFNSFLLEDGNTFLYEDNTEMVLENFQVPDWNFLDRVATNETIQKEADDFLDFSEKTPFQKGFKF